MLERTATIRSNTCVGPGLWELVLVVEDIPEQVAPGQFVQVQLGVHSEFIARRPLSVYAVAGFEQAKPASLVLIYQVVGKGTEYLTRFKAGGTVQVLGPLGRGWQPPQGSQRALLVGGGVGWAPLSLLAGSLRAEGCEVHALMGAQSAQALAFFAEQPAHTLLSYPQGQDVAALYEHFATDDGSRGYHGFTTELMARLLAISAFDYVATCGPEPMQLKVAELAAQAHITCEVSLERRMACGIGACLSCVVDTKQGKKRACADGPVFNGQEVCW